VTKRQLEVTSTEAGTRVDRLIAEKHEGISRRALGLLFADGLVLVNGRRARKGDRVHVGDQVTFDPEDASVAARPASAGGVLLALVTSDLIVMNKPAGVPSTAVPGRVDGTAAGQLLTLFPELAGVGYGAREPGLVHRLDTQTSGLLLAARHAEAFSALQQQLRAGAIEKKYLAIAVGIAPAAGRVDSPLEPDPSHPRRVRVATERQAGRSTEFRRLEVAGGHSLLEVTLARGYRHQIRAHLASVGLPLAGDVLYGGPPSGLSPRHALHASSLVCSTGPFPFQVEAGLPEDLRQFWSRLAD